MPVLVQIVADRGLVWDVEDVVKLRRLYRLVGCMIGGIAGYQNQVAVLGLPLQLSPEEVSLAAAAGWIELYQTRFSIPTEATEAEAAVTTTPAAAAATGLRNAAVDAAVQPSGSDPPTQETQKQQQQQQQQPQQEQEQYDPMQLDEDPEMDEFYAAYYGLELPKQQQQQKPQLQVQQQQPQGQPQPSLEDQQQQQQQQQQAKQKQQQQELQPWQLLIKSNKKVAIPLTIAKAAAASKPPSSSSSSSTQPAAGAPTPSKTDLQQPLPQQQQQQQQVQPTGALSSTPYCHCEPSAWQHPCTPLQWLRLAVFADLHSKGYSVTGGAKFGGDFLAYPGDPQLYHAQYVLRVLLPSQVLVPSVLQGLARGVHAARKHLVLATVQAGAGSGEGAALEAAAAAEGIDKVVAATVEAVGGLLLSYGMEAIAAGGEDDGGGRGSGDSSLTAVAAEVAAAATHAASGALFHGAERIGPVQLHHAAAAVEGGDAVMNGGGVGGVSHKVGCAVKAVGVLRYIVISREWGGE